jgi:AcrR family transcriptional regulator
MPARGRASGSSDTAQVITEAAIRLFGDRGYHGTSIRDIAGEANVGIATLFHHHKSKLALLRKIMNAGFDDLLARMDEAVVAAGDDPTRRFRAAVRPHVRCQSESPMESAIATSELRSVEPPVREELAAKRDRVHRIFADAIAAGVADGAFACDTPRETARAVHAMCAAVSGWYRADGAMSPQDVGELYVGMALRLVGARELVRAGGRMSGDAPRALTRSR